MIDFTETVRRDGSTVAALDAHGKLPECMGYRIIVSDFGKVTSRSKAYGKGSIRYHEFASYQDALDHATRWAKRKIAEVAREDRKGWVRRG